MTGLNNLDLKKNKFKQEQKDIQPKENTSESLEEKKISNSTINNNIEKKLKEEKKKKKSIFAAFQEKFIKYINDTE